MNEFPNIFTDLWDRGLGVFDRLADFELTRREFDLAADVFAFREANAAENAARQAAFVQPVNSGLSVNSNTLLLLVAAGVGVFLLTR